MKILFVGQFSGRLANRLIDFTHCLALAKAHGYIIVPCAFGWEKDFVGTRKHLLSRYVLLRSAAKMVRQINVSFDNPNESIPVISEALRKGESATLNLDTWLPLPLWQDLPVEDYRRYFTPTKRHLNAARRVCARARAGDGPLVGVHIRHGDFEHHDGGRWFLPLETVLLNMRHLLTLQPDAQFLICSDAKFSASDFPDVRVTFGPGDAVSDLTALAFCDLILKTSHSTFGLWASWWGETASVTMHEQPNFQLSNFSIPKLDPLADSQDH